MIYINLLPVKDIKRRNKARQDFFALFFVFLGVLVALVAASLYFNSEKSKQVLSNSSLNKQLAEQKKLVEQVEAVDKEIKEQQRRIRGIKNLREVSQRTVQIFVDLANYIPTNRIWLTKLQQSQKSNTLELQGIALDNSTVALYLDELKKIKDIEEAILIQSSSEKYNERSVVRFQIRCTVKAFFI